MIPAYADKSHTHAGQILSLVICVKRDIFTDVLATKAPLHQPQSRRVERIRCRGMTFKTSVLRFIGSAAVIGLLAHPLMAQGFVPPSDGRWDWCGTQRVYEQKYRDRFGAAAAPEACDQNGPCDNPTERDTWIPGAGGPVQYVRLMIHLVALDDGSNPFSTPEDVAAQVAELNANYAPVGIQFTYQLHQINSTAWRTLSESEIDAMKNATAIEPDKYLNVWVTVVDFSYSFGTFPWSYNALLATGGIVMGHFHWNEVPNRVFAHEVGHTLGLYHTFHGVDEVTACGACYEPPQSNSSLIGDLCSDTPPTPTNQGPCVNFPGSDPCSGLPWGYTMPENYMGYANQSCLTTFTPQQIGRLRCWSNTVLDNWSIPFQVAATPILGQAPLTVDFSATTHKADPDWSWDFGDGGSAVGSAPTHVYNVPGAQTVAVDLQTPDKLYQLQYESLVEVYADTLDILDELSDGSRLSVLVYARNYLPLSMIEIPILYAGDFDLKYDSVTTTGLRSSAMQGKTRSWVENQNRATVSVEAPSGSSLAPGYGPVARIHFTNMQPNRLGVVPIVIAPYSIFNLSFSASAGKYVPVSYGGLVTASCCRGIVGDVNGDLGYEPTIGDVSMLISHLFVDGYPIECFLEADINQSGGIGATSSDLTIGDISMLIDYLFVSGTPIPNCL
jgi:hypothetical protein